MRDQRQRTDDTRRRRAMVWLLHNAGATYREIGEAMGISAVRAWEIGRTYENTLRNRASSVSSWNEPWARRLRAAGAIP